MLINIILHSPVNMAKQGIMKRGLFNAGGYIFRGLFGLATLKDIRALNGKLFQIQDALNQGQITTLNTLLALSNTTNARFNTMSKTVKFESCCY